jgi:uncharacterized protein (TIGR02996 family)
MLQQMFDDDAFLAAVCECPDDDGPRLIYADYLDERGDPRGQFIRIQCALAQLTENDPNRPALEECERTLHESFARKWTSSFRGIANGAELRRGFVETVNVEARVLLLRADELFRLGPIRHLRLLDVAGLLDEVLQSADLGRISELTIAKQHLGVHLARSLLKSPSISKWTALRLGRNRLGDLGVELLARSPLLAQLKQLVLSENSIGNPGALALSTSPHLANLERLELQVNEVGFSGLESLGTSDRLPRLVHLNLAQNQIGVGQPYRWERDGALAPRLRCLDVSENALQPATIAPLVSATWLAAVETLDLNRNQLGNAGLEVLAGSRCLQNVRSLHLNANQIGDTGLRALTQSPYLENLTQLDLSHNPIHDIGAMALLEARSLSKLRSLAVPHLGLSARIRLALQARFGKAARRGD